MAFLEINQKTQSAYTYDSIIKEIKFLRHKSVNYLVHIKIYDMTNQLFI